MKRLKLFFLKPFSIELLCDSIRKKSIKMLKGKKRKIQKDQNLLLILRKIDEIRKLIKSV